NPMIAEGPMHSLVGINPMIAEGLMHSLVGTAVNPMITAEVLMHSLVGNKYFIESEESKLFLGGRMLDKYN
ncbi:3391_t:CDS:2, partial [Racocetra persica]